MTTGTLNQDWTDNGNESLWWCGRDALRHAVWRVSTAGKDHNVLYAVALRRHKNRLKAVSHWNRLYAAYCTCYWQRLELTDAEIRALAITELNFSTEALAAATAHCVKHCQLIHSPLETATEPEWIGYLELSSRNDTVPELSTGKRGTTLSSSSGESWTEVVETEEAVVNTAATLDCMEPNCNEKTFTEVNCIKAEGTLNLLNC